MFGRSGERDGEANQERQGGSLKGAGKVRTVFLVAGLFGVLAAVGVMLLLGRAADRTTYWVLNQDVPARSQLLPSMLEEVTVNVGGEPVNALTPEDLSGGKLFAQVPLAAGDVISGAVAGELTRIGDEAPEGFSPVSFAVSPENAVAGKVRRGDFIDIIAVRDSDLGREAHYVLTGVQVLDVTVAPSTIAEGANDDVAPESLPGPESNLVRGGIPSLYTVALSPEDIVKLSVAMQDQLMIALTNTPNPEKNLGVASSEAQVYGFNPRIDGVPVPEDTNPDVTVNDTATP